MSPSNDFEKLVGETVTFTCVLEGIPTPNVTWYHNGGNPRGVTSVSGSNRNMATLTISSSAVGDTGMYQCIAENWVGKVQASWALQVRTPSESITHIHTPTHHTCTHTHTHTCTHTRTHTHMHIHTCTRVHIQVHKQCQYFLHPPSSSAISPVSSSSSDIYTMDTGIGLPLLVAATDGGDAVLFAEVTADPCPTIQWTVNRSDISSGGAGYTLNNPCSSPAGTTSFNFTLTIAATSARTGRYAATLMNPAGTQTVMPVFVTPPGTLALRGYS